MAAIKAIEAQSVHKIQSGQVIVDLCSVAKELVENSLDAGATFLEIRFKNNGLDSIEVQDNGAGIDPSNYENIALKHYTSKLSSYDDLSYLQTFGFRGEALSSLCALSKFSIVTAQADEAPKGKRLEFETSGRLKSTSIVAAQKGTTAFVENLFENLPVRQKELSKNIKREYAKVLGLLHAYACISVNVKFAVKNAMPKGKSVVVFSTHANSAVRDNIANVYGAKTLTALVALDLVLELRPSLSHLTRFAANEADIKVRGYISKPGFGEGRQTPDRQMFFVNGRPCGLPQIAKAINEVYKSYNVSQSPFVFADFCMDTNSYDVNVSPDKRTILLHDSTDLIDQLKKSLTEMFDKQDQTIPYSQHQTSAKAIFSSPNIAHDKSPSVEVNDDLEPPSQMSSDLNLADESFSSENAEINEDVEPNTFMHDHFRNLASTREVTNEPRAKGSEAMLQRQRENQAQKIGRAIKDPEDRPARADDSVSEDLVYQKSSRKKLENVSKDSPLDIRVRDFNFRMAEQQARTQCHGGQPDVTVRSAAIAGGSRSSPVGEYQPGVVQTAFDRMRPSRVPAELATITIGDQVVTKIIGTQLPKKHELKNDHKEHRQSKRPKSGLPKNSQLRTFSQGLRKFGAVEASDTSGDNTEDGSDSEGAESVSEHQDDEREKFRSSDDFSQLIPGAGTEVESSRSSRSPSTQREGNVDDDSDPEYFDEAAKRNQEKARVAELIQNAEESAVTVSKSNLLRANQALKGGQAKYVTADLLAVVETSSVELQYQMDLLKTERQILQRVYAPSLDSNEFSEHDEEEKLSLTVSKNDFAAMRIVGQFNLGFILAVRPGLSHNVTNAQKTDFKDELFIIDQHASDEKYNFERLQAETIVGNQRLVRPTVLDLTAVEEEIILENLTALETNGFLFEFDGSGQYPVGRRCTLISLPLSKEVVFDSNDLDELIHLLSESPSSGSVSTVPRPSKVRKMFAMRACRSSIMIGKSLSYKQMSKVIKQMGLIDKPWNCPHGRPTMRHLASLNTFSHWKEGNRVSGDGQNSVDNEGIWHQYASS